MLKTHFAATCLLAAARVCAADVTSTGQQVSTIGASGSSAGPAAYFTGQVRIEPVFPATGDINVSAGRVTFSPGARSAWHTHPTGQYLIVTEGVGLTQEWNQPIRELHVGNVVWCPPGVKHWHGAAPGSSMTHIAVTGMVDGKNVNWMGKVSDEQYLGH
ncbi:cupin 2 domain-containing protein [Cupriavidus sp. HMR-1]|uniref:(R)-mandelonitrile lyase n=1 Tax=Cupriavidus TaxID=106589 RepID=UPI0002A3C2C6|nr:MULTISPECIES: cupin domain-containing protein [Cupriavidus]EKZ95363.1 cupin 2 domain-containing protein [Cupriavidus sp. HMR-1]